MITASKTIPVIDFLFSGLLFFTIVALPCQAQESQTPDPSAIAPSSDDVQSMSPDAWRCFTELEVILGSGSSDQKILYRFQADEIEEMMQIEFPDGGVISRLRIPGAASLRRFQTKEEVDDTDLYALAGLQFEYVIFFMNKAYPSGPESIEGEVEKLIEDSGETETIRYWGAGWDFKPPWKMRVNVKKASESRWDYSLVYSVGSESVGIKRYHSGYWSCGATGPLVPDDERLENWEITYYGLPYRDREGEPANWRLIGDTGSFETMGDIREAMNNVMPMTGVSASQTAMPKLLELYDQLENASPSVMFDMQMEAYYRRPIPMLVESMIHNIGNDHLFREDENRIPPAVAFFSEVFAEHTDQLDAWTDIILKMDDEEKAIFRRALELSGDPKQILEQTEPSTNFNDMCWGGFFASGEWVYLDKLIEHLKYFDEQNDFALFLTGASAMWSLATHAQSHLGVRFALEEAKEKADERTRSIIEDTLTRNPDDIQEETIKLIRSRNFNSEEG